MREVGASAAAGDKGGRRKTLLQLNPERGYVVGVKLLEGAITTVVTDLEARVVYHDTIPVRRGKNGWNPTAVISTTVQRVRSVINTAIDDPSRVLGVGVGVTGIVEADNRVIFSRLFPGEGDVPIGDELARQLGLPVYVENDVDTLAIAERWFGVGKGCDNFAVVTIGKGIGAGLVVAGQLVKGACGGAGELGHLVVDPNGPQCECGHNGCLQAVAADPAVVDRIATAIRAGRPTSLSLEGLDIDAVFCAAENGDQLAREELALSGEQFGRGIAYLTNILAPERVIVSGEGIGAGNWRIDPMLRVIRREVFAPIAGAVDIRVERLGFEAWARGAACIVLGKLFASPVAAG